MNQCTVVNPTTKQECGGGIMSQRILTDYQKNKTKHPIHLCDNPSCSRYFICEKCGKSFGHHFD